MDFLKNIDFGELFGKVKDLLGKVDWGDLLNKIKPVLSKIGDFLKKTPSMFAALVLFLTLLVDPAAGSTTTSTLVSEDVLTLMDASFAGNGLTNDGTYYYTSGCISFAKYTALAKYEMGTMKRVKNKVFPVGWDLIKKGYDRIGGISYYDGMIYAAMESDKGKASPCIAVFDADSLSYKYSVDLPESWFPNGISWVAVDPLSGILYTADKGAATSIHAFKIDATMAPIREIDITGLDALENIRGGEFDGGILYLSCDPENDTQYDEVLCVNVETGEAESAFIRDVGKADSKPGDITIVEAKDGSVFHVADYNGILGVYIRNYIAN